ncbi:MAG: dockerin type I domain-containing protein, partial [Gemmatimonadota bacterium]|nr:dockerin type I domain-containing protein [Gemmatimonadota bacterium]
MIRSNRASIFAPLSILVFSAASVEAQTFEFEIPDSVLAVPAGMSGRARLVFSDYSYCAGVSSYSVTVFYDQARVRMDGAQATGEWPNIPAPVVDTSVAGQATLSGVGGDGAACWNPIADLSFAMDPLALEGSLISVRVNSIADFYGADGMPLLPRTGLLEVCHAVGIYGDVNGDFAVNSRDALVVLTEAVGLPVSGFDLTFADVTNDGSVNTRDALMILSAGIGLSLPWDVTAGQGIPDRCAPLSSVSEPLAFFRSSTVHVMAPLDTIPTNLGVAATTSYSPTWSPDASLIAFSVFVSGFGTDILTVTTDGLTVDTLFAGIGNDWGPSWSRDGTQISYVSSSVSPQSVFIMNADGSNPTQVTTTHVVYQASWSPDGSKIAFVGYDQALC